MEEGTHRAWDVATKIAAPFVTVFGLWLGVYQYNRQRAEQIEQQHRIDVETDRKEFKRRMWEKQLDIYLRMSSVAGRIVAGGQSKEQLNKDIFEFESLYWGQTTFVEDKEVGKAMYELHVAIYDLQKGTSDGRKLPQLVTALNNAFKESSNRYWYNNERN